MQIDLFAEPLTEIKRPKLELLAHALPDYVSRTRENAREGDVTAAFAVDFTTRGEILTERLAGKARYVRAYFGTDISEAATALRKKLDERRAKTLNIAGNGIYTLCKDGFTQEAVNRWVLAVLREALKDYPLEHIRSGGQTGVDQAGLVAGLVLGIPVTGLYPAKFLRRLANHRDVFGTEVSLRAEITSEADVLLRT